MVHLDHQFEHGGQNTFLDHGHRIGRVEDIDLLFLRDLGLRHLARIGRTSRRDRRRRHRKRLPSISDLAAATIENPSFHNAGNWANWVSVGLVSHTAASDSTIEPTRGFLAGSVITIGISA